MFRGGCKRALIIGVVREVSDRSAEGEEQKPCVKYSPDRSGSMYADSLIRILA